MAKHELIGFGLFDHPAALLARSILPVLFLSVVFLSSCAPKPEPSTYVPPGYSAWQRTTELRLDYPIPGHEDNYRIIYINDIGLGFSRTGAGQTEHIEFPEGTVIAKEVYDGASPGPGVKPMMVTAMIKEASNPDAKGGWVWVAKDLSMGQETIIKGTFCFSCHTNANEAHPYGDRNLYESFRDYVFFIPGGSTMTSSDESPGATVPGGDGY